jgi:hypothetical protein
MSNREPVRFEGLHCVIEIRRPAPRVVLVSLSGTDAGELGDAAFVELARDIDAPEPIELFIDAREGRAASIDVSGSWANWLGKHKTRFQHISMLTATRFIQLSADLVKRFSGLGETMRIYTDARSFDDALRESVERSSQQ